MSRQIFIFLIIICQTLYKAGNIGYFIWYPCSPDGGVCWFHFTDDQCSQGHIPRHNNSWYLSAYSVLSVVLVPLFTHPIVLISRSIMIYILQMRKQIYKVIYGGSKTNGENIYSLLSKLQSYCLFSCQHSVLWGGKQRTVFRQAVQRPE